MPPRSSSGQTLPDAGAAFAFPIVGGRFGVCRVILGQNSQQAKRWGRPTILVACSDWIGSHIPHSDDPLVGSILEKSHHAWNHQRCIAWISDPPPSDLISIGTITPSPVEQYTTCNSLGSWESLTSQPLAQWRWDNERELVLAEDVIKAKVKAEARVRSKQDRDAHLKRVTLADLHVHQFFSEWITCPSKEAVQASRDLMHKTVEQLLNLGTDATEQQRMDVLQACIESFNELDEKLEFIETVERENICQEFEAIVHACGLGMHEKLADQWREW